MPKSFDDVYTVGDLFSIALNAEKDRSERQIAQPRDKLM
jgi:hypothetical protein